MAEPNCEDLAARLAWARSVAGLSAYALSVKAKLAKGHVLLIETHVRRNIDVKTAQSIAAVLGISWAWLLSGEGDPPTEAQIQQAIVDGAA